MKTRKSRVVAVSKHESRGGRMEDTARGCEESRISVKRLKRRS